VPFRSKAQRRWMYAAERRGEVPKGTARTWEFETHGKIPEKVMKKEGMFMGRTQETAEDGMFMKFAGVPMDNKGQKGMDIPKIKPVKPTKPAINTSGMGNNKGTKTLGAQGFQPMKTASLAERIGHPAIGRPGIKTAELSTARLKSDASNFGDKALKGGKELYERGSKGVKELAGKSLDWFEHLTPQQAALIAGGAGLYGAHKTIKGVRGLAGAAKTGRAIRAARAARAANPSLLKRLGSAIARRGR